MSPSFVASPETRESACALADNLAEGIRLILGDIDLPLSQEKSKNARICPRCLPSAIFLRENGH